MGFGAFHPRQIRLLTNYLIVAAVADRGCRSQRLRLQIAPVEKNCSGAFHFIERAVDVPGVQVDSTAAIQDDMRIESEMVRVERLYLTQ